VCRGKHVAHDPRIDAVVLQRSCFLLVILTCVLLVSVARAVAADDDPAKASSETAKAPPTGFLQWGMDKHPVLRIGSVASLELHARVEGDERLATPAIGLDAAEYAWRHPRVGLEGAVTKRLHFQFSRNLDDATNPWKDLEADIRINKKLTIEAGRFKMPFGRDALTGHTELDFVNRTLASRNLSPSRDTGVMGFGRFFGHRLEYAAGYFTGDGDHGRTASTTGGHDAIAARLLVTPFGWMSSGRLAAWQVGVAVTESRLDDQLGLRAQTLFHDNEFFNHVVVNGRRQRLGLESAWAIGPLSVTGEYITTSEQRKGMGFSEEDLPDVRARSWYLSGAWVLTGERKKGHITPEKPLFRGGGGALELVARVEALAFDEVSYPGTAFEFPKTPKLLGNSDHATTIGINWYVNPYVRFLGDVVTEALADPSRSPAPSTNGRFTSAVIRLQFNL
jgi:phosphate-selective porin OprO and OprP